MAYGRLSVEVRLVATLIEIHDSRSDRAKRRHPRGSAYFLLPPFAAVPIAKLLEGNRLLERAMGIEPTSEAWGAQVLGRSGWALPRR